MNDSQSHSIDRIEASGMQTRLSRDAQMILVALARFVVSRTLPWGAADREPRNRASPRGASHENGRSCKRIARRIDAGTRLLAGSTSRNRVLKRRERWC